jgi:hypothetical protein
MSEVMRWKLKGFIPGVDGVSKALFQPWVVPAEDFDRVTAERDALQLRLNTADERADLLEVALRAAMDATAKSQTERNHQIPGTSGMRLNMLAN